jgi:hypothetical protein
MRKSYLHFPNRQTPSTSPPVSYSHHAFVSYTTREDEVQEVKPWIDALGNRLVKLGITFHPIYYDGWYLERVRRSPTELGAILAHAIGNCAFTISFLSPGYVKSPWCRYEWQATRALHTRRSEPAPEYSIFPIVWKQIPTRSWNRCGREFLREVNHRLAWDGHGFVPPQGEAINISASLGSVNGSSSASWHFKRVLTGYLDRWYPDVEWQNHPGFSELF